MIAAEALRQELAVEDHRWSGIHVGAKLLGLSTRDFVDALDVECTVPDSPELRTRVRRKRLALPRRLVAHIRR